MLYHVRQSTSFCFTNTTKWSRKWFKYVFNIFFSKKSFQRYFYSLLDLFSAYYMSSLEGIREWMHSNSGNYCYCLSCDLSIYIYILLFYFNVRKSFDWNNNNIIIMHERLVHYLKRIEVSSSLFFFF
jgi:hypothetical protein